GTIEQWRETAPFQALWQLKAAQLCQRWVDINELHQRVGLSPRRSLARQRDDKGRAGRFLVRGLLETPHAVLSESEPVIADHHHHGLARQVEAIQFIQDAAYQGIDVAGARVVTVQDL